MKRENNMNKVAAIGAIAIAITGIITYQVKPDYDSNALGNMITDIEKGQISEKELNCMVDNLYHEARGEPEHGQRAVVQVVLNRMADNRWPDTICGVVYYPYAFSWVYEQPTIQNKRLWEELKLKTIVWLSEPMTWWNANHYHADYVDPYWNKDMTRVAGIGDHIFYVD